MYTTSLVELVESRSRSGSGGVNVEVSSTRKSPIKGYPAVSTSALQTRSAFANIKLKTIQLHPSRRRLMTLATENRSRTRSLCLSLTQQARLIRRVGIAALEIHLDIGVLHALHRKVFQVAEVLGDHRAAVVVVRLVGVHRILCNSISETATS